MLGFDSLVLFVLNCWWCLYGILFVLGVCAFLLVF